MKLSTKVRYGLRAMIELAKQSDGQTVALRTLAQNQQISPKYLEQMAASLKIAGLIESVRGAEGGYRLARPAEQISAWDIYNVLDVAVEPIECVGKNRCNRDKICAAHELWSEITQTITSILKSHSLAQLAKREMDLERKQKKNTVNNQVKQITLT